MEEKPASLWVAVVDIIESIVLVLIIAGGSKVSHWA